MSASQQVVLKRARSTSARQGGAGLLTAVGKEVFDKGFFELENKVYPATCRSDGRGATITILSLRC